jgi:histone deacetylase complex regulatory component SIN3
LYLQSRLHPRRPLHAKFDRHGHTPSTEAHVFEFFCGVCPSHHSHERVSLHLFGITSSTKAFLKSILSDRSPKESCLCNMRELRVEDALLYLDQVKVEFGDRPHIYNEFLDIMKTFKTQQIDTPGVIRRVSNLFQGNRRLVLGFNTFLPEGYRIEIPMDGNGPPVAVYRAPGSNVAHILRESAESQAVSVSQQSAAGGGGVGPPQQQHYHPGGMPGGVPHQQQRMLSPQAAMAEHHAAGGGLPYGPSSLNRPQQQQQQQQQAPKPQQHPMLPLNDAGGVVMRPMSQQQQQQQQRPMDVGMGQHQQQLPGGVAPRMMGNSMQQQMMNNNMQQQQQRGKEMMQLQAMQQQQMAMSQPPQMQQVMGPPQMNNVMTADGSAFGVAVETMNASPPVALGGGGGGQPLEFDHAINYVTTIKRRFASEPETYKKFLEILHTYQKEQRGIKEVLDEVSELFEDHPDLLKEFTFFLPDAVQATAKMQLDQAAKESENRKRTKAKAAIMNAAQAMQRQAQQQQTGNIKPSHEIHSDRLVAAPSGGPYQPPTPTSRSSSYERENLISRGARYGTVLFDPVRPPRKQQAVKQHGRPRTVPELPVAPTTTEEAFFQHAKDHLNRKELASDKPSGSRRHTPHSEFLKCLHLFGAGVLSKEELTSLLRVLFLQGHAPKTGVNAGGGYHNPSVANSAAELMREYEEVLIGRGPYADQQDVLKDKSKYGCLRIRDFDLHTATQVSPSYFTYPNDYPHALFLSHPGQTTLDELVLNSKVMCVYAGSNEDSVDGGGSARSTSGNGKHHRGQNGIKRKYCPSIEESDGSKQRCNVYEEMMFRIEDERFELDMAIERNAHALRRIEPFAKEAQAFREQEEKDGQPIGRLRYQLHRSSLNTIHINAIARIYGDRGDEILQHLLQNPLIVLPVVYQRLKQKDAEWRNAKNELSERWSSICESNYEGCLDTQCYFNRKALEKSFSSARLLEQCRKARLYVKYPDKIKDHPATRFFAPKFGRSLSQPGALMYQPYMEVQCRVDVSHKYALDLIFQRLKHSSSVTEFVRERIGRVFAEFLVPWFHYPLHWVNMEVRDSFRGKMNPSVTKCTYFAVEAFEFRCKRLITRRRLLVFATSCFGTTRVYNFWRRNCCFVYGF